MKIQPQYRVLGARLEMFRRNMPDLGSRKVIEGMRLLREASGERLMTNPGEIGTLLAGFKPAVSYSLPDSPAALHAVEQSLRTLGFCLSSRPEELKVPHGFPLRIRSGLIWSGGAAGELYGLKGAQLEREIAGLLAPERVLTLPGFLLGYADDSSPGHRGNLVSVAIEFSGEGPGKKIVAHRSLAARLSEAEELTRYYEAAAHRYIDLIGLDYCSRVYSLPIFEVEA